MAGWPVGVVEVHVHGCCTAAGAARTAWSTGWCCVDDWHMCAFAVLGLVFVPYQAKRLAWGTSLK